MRRLLVLVVVVLVVGGVFAGLFVVRGGLADDRDAVDDAWVPVAEAVGSRADAIGLLAEAISEVPEASGTHREVVDEATAEVALWWEAYDAGEPTGVQVTIANTLEGLAARLASTVIASSVLSSAESVTAAMDRLQVSAIPSGFVNVYNDAVDSYDDRRESFVGKPVAGLLGFEAAVAFAPVDTPTLPPTDPAEEPVEAPAAP